MFLQPEMLVKLAFLVVLCSLQVVLGILNYLLNVLSEVHCIRHLAVGTHNNVNKQPNLFSIYHLK